MKLSEQEFNQKIVDALIGHYHQCRKIEKYGSPLVPSHFQPYIMATATYIYQLFKANGRNIKFEEGI